MPLESVRASAGRPAGRRRSAPKQDRAVRTNAQLLEAAAAVFSERGYFRVSLLDIAEQAGVTRGALYFHYANREALATAVSEEYYRRLAALVADVRQLSLPPLDATAELLTRVALALRDDKVVQAAIRLHMEHTLIDGTLPTPFVDFISSLAELLEQARAEGQLPERSSPKVLARVLVSAFFGAQHISWALEGRDDIIERIQEVIDTVLPRTSSD